MAVETFEEVDQGSAEWHRLRCGIPTASNFATVMAKGEGKTRSKYMRELAGEIITGECAESYSNAHMERGKEQEDDARRLYAFLTDSEPQLVGFIRNGKKGASGVTMSYAMRQGLKGPRKAVAHLHLGRKRQTRR